MSDANNNGRPPAPKYYLTADVKAAAVERWPWILGHFGVRSEFLVGRHGPCPGCGGKDRFRFDDLGGAGTFICSQGTGENLIGDGLKLLGHVKGWDWKRCVEEVGRFLDVEMRTGKAPSGGEGVAAEPKSDPAARPQLDDYMLWEATRGMPTIDEEWLRRRSPIDLAGVGPGEFLDALFEIEDRILIFTSQWSQGDFLWRVGNAEKPGRSYRLAQERGVKAVTSSLPEGAEDGVWFLVQPVSAMWEIAPKPRINKVTNKPEGYYTRRSEINVTGWRHFVLESDELEASRWLQVIASLRFPIVAIYTSGKRSVHALLKMPAPSKVTWDAMRDGLRQIVCPLGADPGALSAVRLSRLPGCRRGKNLQQLLFLNPRADGTAIQLMPEVRK